MFPSLYDAIVVNYCIENFQRVQQVTAQVAFIMTNLPSLEFIDRLSTDGPPRMGILPLDEIMDFDKGFYVTVKAIQQIRARAKGTVFVAIAGPSGAGKTSLAQKVLSILPRSALISMDNYLDSTREVFDMNFDDFRLMDFELLRNNLKELRDGNATKTPLYDFRKSGRYAWKTVEVPKSRVVIVEGTYALREELRELMNLRVSVQGGVHFDLVKRINRDVTRTGQNPEEALQQIVESVYPMYKGFIEPDLRQAEIRLVNSFNPFSGLLSPTYTLKSKMVPSEDRIKEALLALSSAAMKKSQKSRKSTQGETQLSPAAEVGKTCEKYYDIYFRPPQVEGQIELMKGQWIRVRNTDGQYLIMFSEIIREGNFLISPRIEFPVSSKIIGGLLGLEYVIDTKLDRVSTIYAVKDVDLIVTVDEIEELGGTFVQLKGSDRFVVEELGKRLGLDGTYETLSYIELWAKSQGRDIGNTPSNLPRVLSYNVSRGGMLNGANSSSALQLLKKSAADARDDSGTSSDGDSQSGKLETSKAPDVPVSSIVVPAEALRQRSKELVEKKVAAESQSSGNQEEFILSNIEHVLDQRASLALRKSPVGPEAGKLHPAGVKKSPIVRRRKSETTEMQAALEGKAAELSGLEKRLNALEKELHTREQVLKEKEDYNDKLNAQFEARENDLQQREDELARKNEGVCTDLKRAQQMMQESRLLRETYAAERSSSMGGINQRVSDGSGEGLRTENKQLKEHITNLERDLKKITLMAQYDLQATVLHKDEVIADKNKLILDLEDLNARLYTELDLVHKRLELREEEWSNKSAEYGRMLGASSMRSRGIETEEHDHVSIARKKEILMAADDDAKREYDYRKFYTMLKLENEQHMERLKLAFQHLGRTSEVVDTAESTRPPAHVEKPASTTAGDAVLESALFASRSDDHSSKVKESISEYVRRRESFRTLKAKIGQH